MSRRTYQADAGVAFGHCNFCNRPLDVMIMATCTLLTPFGECERCRRFTIWSDVDASAVAPSVRASLHRAGRRAS
jgi:hypothetical protein